MIKDPKSHLDKIIEFNYVIKSQLTNEYLKDLKYSYARLLSSISMAFVRKYVL